jgi:hypothetical protein
MPNEAQAMLDLARQQGVSLGKPQALVGGKDVMPYYQNQGGKHIGEAVQDAYKAQLQGRITTTDEARQWLNNYLRSKAGLLRGDDVLPYFENRGGPHIGQVLNDAWDAQNAGEFDNQDSAREWLARRMEKPI